MRRHRTSVGRWTDRVGGSQGFAIPWISRRIGSPSGWSGVARAMVLLLLAVPYLAVSWAETTWFLHNPAQAPYFDIEVLRTYQLVVLGMLVVGILLLLMGASLRARAPSSRAYQLVVVVFCSLLPLVAGHFFGLHVSGLLVGVLAMSVLSLVLLPGYVALTGIVTWLSVALVHAVLEQMGVIPHAPLLAEAPFDQDGLHPSWMWGMGVFLGSMTVVVIGVVGFVVHKERKLARRLRRLAITDSLTGAFNRRYFVQALERELERLRRYGQPLGLVLMDLDHFKRVNDQYGHPVGDDVLVEVVRRLQSQLRRSDLLARFGGEEFTVLLPHLDLAQARAAAERLRLALLAEGLAVGGRSITLSASFGVAAAEGPTPLSARELLRRVDQALYDAKASGRGCVRSWPPAGEAQKQLPLGEAGSEG